MPSMLAVVEVSPNSTGRKAAKCLIDWLCPWQGFYRGQVFGLSGQEVLIT